MESMIRRRLLRLREDKSVTQAALAQAMGINNRQSLAEIESGSRIIQPSELIGAAKFFGVNISYFTDPFELAGEGLFSWRKSSTKNEDINNFESKAGKWIAAYRTLRRLKGETVNSSLIQIALDEKSTFEEASSEGSQVAAALELGEVPASNLASVLQETLDILVLNVDAHEGISGAACKLGPLSTVIINRNEPEARRHFDMAHELFHLITWITMPPEHVEEDEAQLSGSRKKIEQLADMFAAGLLMPNELMLNYIRNNNYPSNKDLIPEWIKSAALHFRVSGQAMMWRLVGLGYVSQPFANKIKNSVQTDLVKTIKPALFSLSFLEIISWGIESGELSVRKAANLLQLNIDDLADLFVEYGLKTPFDI